MDEYPPPRFSDWGPSTPWALQEGLSLSVPWPPTSDTWLIAPRTSPNLSKPQRWIEIRLQQGPATSRRHLTCQEDWEMSPTPALGHSGSPWWPLCSRDCPPPASCCHDFHCPVCACVCVCVCVLAPAHSQGQIPPASHTCMPRAPQGAPHRPLPPLQLSPHVQAVPKDRLDPVQLKVGWTQSLPPLSLEVTVALELDFPPPITPHPSSQPSITALCTWQAVGCQRCGLRLFSKASHSPLSHSSCCHLGPCHSPHSRLTLRGLLVLDLGLWLRRPPFQPVSKPAVGRWDGGVAWVVPWVPESHTLVLPVGYWHLSCRVTHRVHGPCSQGPYPRGRLWASQHYDMGPTGLSRHPCPRGRWRWGGKEGQGGRERRQNA